LEFVLAEIDCIPTRTLTVRINFLKTGILRCNNCTGGVLKREVLLDEPVQIIV